MRTPAIRGAFRGTAAAALLSAAALGLAGCGNSEQAAPPGAGSSVSYGIPPTTAPATAGGQHSPADVAFLSQVVPLRQQVLQIAGLAQTASTNQKVKDLAQRILDDPSQPHVDTLNGYLTQWGQPTPTTAAATASATPSVPGLLSEAQLEQLSTVKGADFDTQWGKAIQQNLTATQQAVAAITTAGTSQQVKQVAQQWGTVLAAELTQLQALTG